MSSAFPLYEPQSRFNYLVAKKERESAIRKYPWYDAAWLRQYVAAKKVIARFHPKMLTEFISAFDRLRTRPDFAVRKLGRVFDDDVMERIRETIRTMPADTYEKHEIKRFGRMVVHDHPFFTDLQKSIQPLVSELAGEIVEPCYNFLSLYSQFGVCEPHMDTPRAKWTLDLCIEQTNVWPIHFSQIVPWPEQFAYQGEDWQASVKQSPDLQFTSYSLQPNEAVLFSGSSQWHYRDALTDFESGGFCNLVFFHYLPEGMRELATPRSWPKMFGIPELVAVVGAPT